MAFDGRVEQQPPEGSPKSIEPLGAADTAVAPAASVAALSQAPKIPDHHLIRRIGGGSYGEVWLARNALGAYRAVKIVRRRTFEHDRPFEREFGGIQKFEPISRSHEGLVDLLQVGRNDQEGYFYYVMELADAASAQRSDGVMECRGDCWGDGQQSSSQYSTTPPLHTPGAYAPRTLRHDLARRGRLPFDECIRLGLALTSALAHLHKHGLVHRDIKPSNIIFVDGVPKLADVGLVAGVDEARSYVGTEGFIPPEGPGSPPADLYSLGIVLYVMSTGKSHSDFPEPLPDLSSDPDHTRWLELNAVIHKACQTQVNERYRSAEEMWAELALLQRGQSVKRKRVQERRRAMAEKLGLGTAALALLAITLVLVKPFKHERALNPDAVRLYELGRWHYNQLTAEAHKKAVDYLNQAVQIEPDYTDAYRVLFEIQAWGLDGGEERLSNCRRLAQKMMALNPKLAEAHTALSMCKYLEGDWSSAEEEIRQAIQLNRKYSTAHGIYCYYLSLLGRWEEALPHVKRIQELDPTSRAQMMVGSYPFITARQYDKALTQLNRVVELDRNFPAAHMFIGRVYEAQSNFPAAIEEFKTYDLLVGKHAAEVTGRYEALRDAYFSSGEPGYWWKLLQFQEADDALPKEEKIFAQVDRWPQAGIYARLGEEEKALALLEEDFAKNEGNDWLKFEPLYDSLRDEPRFKALLKKAGLEK